MTKEIKKNYALKTSRLGAIALGAATLASSGSALAGPAPAGNNFSTISDNIAQSIADVPGLMSAVAYLVGVILAILGVLKIKDHVENPTQTPLKDGVIRLAIGGALFALPIMLESMTNTIGVSTVDTQAATLKKATFSTN